MPVQLPGGGWILGLDPYAVKILHKLSKMAREGKNLAEMCRWLTESGVVTPRDRQLQLAAERRGEDPATVALNERPLAAFVAPPLASRPELVEFGIFEPAEQSEISVRLEERARRKTRGSNQALPILGCPGMRRMPGAAVAPTHPQQAYPQGWIHG